MLHQNAPLLVGGKKKKLIGARDVLLQEKKKWSQHAHEVWQIDGKEQIQLGDGSQVSWISIADEATGAHLSAIVYPYRTVAQILLSQAVEGINSCFYRWGLPQKIKIDNGRPLVHPSNRDVPTVAKLWWIGLGIQVIQNSPGCPQQNGTVEGLQATLSNWTNPKEQPNTCAFQQRLNMESEFQRNYYRIPGKERKTRKELYPELLHNNRCYAPEKFDIQRVYQYLSDQVWHRRVKQNGELKIYGQHIYIGKRFAQQIITITFDPIEVQWLFRKTTGTILKTSRKAIPNEKEIKKIAIMSMN